MTKDAHKFCTELSDGGHLIGVHPSKLNEDQFKAAGHIPRPLTKIIRAKCLDCCVGSQDEVRKCVAHACPLWPYRMGSNPLREKREMTEEQRTAAIARLSAARKAKKENENG